VAVIKLGNPRSKHVELVDYVSKTRGSLQLTTNIQLRAFDLLETNHYKFHQWGSLQEATMVAISTMLSFVGII